MVMADTMPSPAVPVSALVLSDRLITLAQAADNAGLRGAATRLVQLAHAVFDEPEADVRN
ncbi:MAG TPA: hypothetical protein VJY39_10450 [Acidisphaera sp.]|nr:hypothetical protein [Acidisphaera sp.]